MNDHSNRAHSIYSPSSWDRWSKCPGSALLTKDMESKSSDASRRGTWMHEMAEGKLGEYLSGMPFIVPAGEKPYDTPENWEAILEAVGIVKKIIEDHSGIDVPTVYLESRIDLDAVGYEAVFGTADVRVYDRFENHLSVIDFKFGYGEVEPTDNGQLYLYAYASCLDLEEVPETVEICVVQPASRETLMTHTMTYTELDAWFKGTGEPAIKAAMTEGAPVIPGEDQCRYCPRSGECPEQRQQNLDVFDKYSPAVMEVGTEKVYHIEDLLPLLPEMENFIKGVRSQAIKLLENGETVEGYKLVRGVTHRKWVDEEAAEKWLSLRKLTKPERTETKVISIAKAEKILKDILKDNTRLRNNFESLITKPEGKLTLAQESDKRPAVTFEDPFEALEQPLGDTEI